MPFVLPDTTWTGTRSLRITRLQQRPPSYRTAPLRTEFVSFYQENLFRVTILGQIKTDYNTVQVLKSKAKKKKSKRIIALLILAREHTASSYEGQCSLRGSLARSCNFKCFILNDHHITLILLSMKLLSF